MANEGARRAESVGSLLEMARASQWRGRLTIRQQGSGSIQQGEVSLQGGQPVFVRLGTMVGQVALTRLLSWRHVEYAFQLDEPARDASGFPVAQGMGATPFPAQTERGLPRARMAGHDASRASLPEVDLEGLVPHKRDGGQDVLSLPLTRRQRLIYLLVDGRRTLSDLSRCSGKTLPDVELIVKELQAQQLVDI